MQEAGANNEALFDEMMVLLNQERSGFGVRRIAALVSFVLDGRVEVGDASRYLYHFARRRGYDIPPYPLAGCGEIKEFFADWGVKNVPEWYAAIGVSSQDYERLHEMTLVVVRNTVGKRTAFLLDGVHYKQDTGFVNLIDSGLVASLGEEALANLLSNVFDYLKSDGAEYVTF